jgi:hypothetical protein
MAEVVGEIWGEVVVRYSPGEMLRGRKLETEAATPSLVDVGDEVRPFSSLPSKELDDWRLWVTARLGSDSKLFPILDMFLPSDFLSLSFFRPNQRDIPNDQ